MRLQGLDVLPKGKWGPAMVVVVISDTIGGIATDIYTASNKVK